MEIILTPYNLVNHVKISEKDYQRLLSIKDDGWSNCKTSLEWFVKLHYLRSGFNDKRINLADFRVREDKLVLSWLKKQF
ncbi:MAG: hypothetical protein JJV97_02800 [SAR324 cluster bacterium]|nr:hypothetical protein [SAR324 cluster bacterium]